MATAISAADGRHTHCSAAVVRAADGRRYLHARNVTSNTPQMALLYSINSNTT